MFGTTALTSSLFPRSRRLIKQLSLFVRYGSFHPTGVHQYDFDGTKLILDFSTPLYRFIYFQDGFEPDVTSILHRAFNEGEVFVDIGANIGWHTLTLLTKRQDVLMSYAYEPSAQTYNLLKRGITANRLDERCCAKRLAISDKAGKATLKTFVGLDPMHTSLFPLADWEYEEEEVELCTLDAQAETFIAPASVIKCDVEGGERDVLLGAKGILSGKFGPPPLWFLEANYEASGMAGFFPWQLIEIAAQFAPYQGYCIRDGQIVKLINHTALRHGDTLILAIPEVHHERLLQAGLKE